MEVFCGSRFWVSSAPGAPRRGAGAGPAAAPLRREGLPGERAWCPQGSGVPAEGGWHSRGAPNGTFVHPLYILSSPFPWACPAELAQRWGWSQLSRLGSIEGERICFAALPTAGLHTDVPDCCFLRGSCAGIADVHQSAACQAPRCWRVVGSWQLRLVPRLQGWRWLELETGAFSPLERLLGAGAGAANRKVWKVLP